MSTRTLLCCCVVLMLLALPAGSVAEGPPQAQEAHGWHPTVKMQVRSEALAMAAMDDGGGKVGVWKNEVSLKVAPFSLGYEIRSYQWADKHRLPLVVNGETPFENLHRLSVGLADQWRVTDDWGVFAGATGTAGFETELENSFGGAFRAGVSYNIDEHWQVIAGGTMFANAIRVQALPILGFVYNGIGEDGTGLIARLTAPDASVTYKFQPWFGMSANFGLDSRFYRLRDGSAVESKGFLATRALEASLLAELSPIPGLRINLGPTFSFAREMTVYDKGGDKVRSPDLDSALGVACEVSYAF